VGGAIGAWRLRHGADLERGSARDPAPPPTPAVEQVAVR
jgi:hypothetical protein